MKVSQLDNDNYFVCQCEGYGGPMPHGCIAAAPPPFPWLTAWPQWDGKKFVMVPDHRQRRIEEGFAPELVQEPTEYWLPPPFGDDTHQSPARTMTERGPLPKGGSLTRPEKTPQEEAAEQSASLQAALDDIDRKSARPLRALASGTATDEDKAMLVDLEAQAAALRGQVRTLASLAASFPA